MCMEVQVSKRQSALKKRVAKFLNAKNNSSVLTEIFTKYLSYSTPESTFSSTVPFKVTMKYL